MTVRERTRALPRVGIVLIAIVVGPPSRAPAGQPDHRLADAGAPAEPASLTPTPAGVHPSSRKPFDLAEAAAPSAYALAWRAVASALDHDRAVLAACRAGQERCPPAARHLLAVIEVARAKQGRARLGEVNRAVNLAIRYESDAVQHGAADAWASPLATLSSGRGDCEDYAIAKYLALTEAGVAPGDLRLVVVRDVRLRRHHAVLAARLEDRWLVLDNRTLLLVDDREVPGYAAVTAFGAETEPLAVVTDSRTGSGASSPANPAPSDPDRS
jgi:predicted transglutaminase-like cysteine proteinase